MLQKTSSLIVSVLLQIVIVNCGYRTPMPISLFHRCLLLIVFIGPQCPLYSSNVYPTYRRRCSQIPT